MRRLTPSNSLSFALGQRRHPPTMSLGRMQPKSLHHHTRRHAVAGSLTSAASRLLMFGPLPLLNSLLLQVATGLARSHPDLFTRMGSHARKSFLIDPTDLPLVFTMSPDTSAPQLSAHTRVSIPIHDGAIVGRFVHLLDMIDGSVDGDALFFSRDLKVTGDVEAVVALRNALDDFDGDLVREILGVFGPLAGAAGFMLRAVRSLSALGESHA